MTFCRSVESAGGARQPVSLRPAADWPGRRGRRSGPGAGDHRPYRRRRGRVRPGPAGPGPEHRPSTTRSAGGTPATTGWAGPAVPGLCTRRRQPASPAPQLERDRPGTPGSPNQRHPAKVRVGEALAPTRGAGNNAPISTAVASSFLNGPWCALWHGWSLAWPERVAGVAGPLADLATTGVARPVWSSGEPHASAWAEEMLGRGHNRLRVLGGSHGVRRSCSN